MNKLLIIIFLLTTVAAVQADSSTTDAQTAFELGKTHQQQRQTRLAIKAYKQAIALKPGFALAHYELGWSYWVEGKWDKVINHWQQAKKLGLQQPQLEQHLKRARDNLLKCPIMSSMSKKWQISSSCTWDN